MEAKQYIQYRIQTIDESGHKATCAQVYYTHATALAEYRRLDAAKRPGTYVILLNEIVDVPTDAVLCDALPEYNGWHPSYEYPGHIFYTRPGQDLVIVATSDWEVNGTLDVQVQDDQGWCSPAPYLGFSGGGVVEWPYEGRTPEKLFALLKPFLDEYQGVVRRHPCKWCGTVLVDDIEDVCATPGEGCCPSSELPNETPAEYHARQMSLAAQIKEGAQ